MDSQEIPTPEGQSKNHSSDDREGPCHLGRRTGLLATNHLILQSHNVIYVKMLKISKWPRAPAFSTLQNDLNCNSTQGTGTFVWGPETLAELGACGGWERRLERRGLRGLDKLLTPYLRHKPGFSNAGEFSAKQEPSLQFTVRAKHKAQLKNTQTTEHVEVRTLEPQERPRSGPGVPPGTAPFLSPGDH